MNLFSFLRVGLAFVLTVTILVPCYASDWVFEMSVGGQKVVPQEGRYIVNGWTFTYQLEPADNPNRLLGTFTRPAQNGQGNETINKEVDLERSDGDFQYNKYNATDHDSFDLYVSKLIKNRHSMPLILKKDNQQVPNVVADKICFLLKKNRQVEFKGGVIAEPDYAGNKTILKLAFGAVDEPEILGWKEIHSFFHTPVSNRMLENTWKLNAQHRFEKVKEVTYSTLSDTQAEFSKFNGVERRNYKKLISVDAGVLAVNPTSIHKPFQPAEHINQYFEFRCTSGNEKGTFLYSDAKYLYHAQPECWQIWKMDLDPATQEVRLHGEENNKYEVYFSTILKKTDSRLLMPPFTGTSEGITFEIHEVNNCGFKKDFYKLTQGGSRQTWQKIGPGPNHQVGIEIAGVNLVDGSTHITSRRIYRLVSENQVTYDILWDTWSIKGDILEELSRNILVTHWLTGLEPTLVCKPEEWKDKNTANITALLKATRCLRLDFSPCVFLLKDEGGNWAVKTDQDYNNRNRFDDKAEWLVAGDESGLCELLKSNSVEILGLGTFVPKEPKTWQIMADSQKLKTIRSAGFTNKDVKDKAVLSKLLNKVEGLESLMVNNTSMLLNYNLRGTLEKSAVTLKHLDLTGASYSNNHGSEFIQAVSKLHGLETLKIIGFYLSNYNTEQLVNSLCPKSHPKLRELHLALPYWGSGAVELTADLYNRMSNDWSKGGFRERTEIACAAFTCVVASPVVWTIGATCDFKSTGSISIEQILKSLSKLPSLKTLSLKAKGLFKHKDGITQVFKESREKQDNKESFTLTFVD